MLSESMCLGTVEREEKLPEKMKFMTNWPDLGSWLFIILYTALGTSQPMGSK